MGETGKETVILGSSNGVIEVEAVGLNKVRGKLARLESLREISLDSEDVALADPPGKINFTCPSVCSFRFIYSFIFFCVYIAFESFTHLIQRVHSDGLMDFQISGILISLIVYSPRGTWSLLLQSSYRLFLL